MEENWSQIQAAVARFDYFKFFRNNQVSTLYHEMYQFHWKFFIGQF